MTCGCHVAAMAGGSGGRPVVAMGGGSGERPVVVMLHQWQEAQEGDLWLSCCIRTAAMGGGSGG